MQQRPIDSLWDGHADLFFTALRPCQLASGSNGKWPKRMRGNDYAAGRARVGSGKT